MSLPSRRVSIRAFRLRQLPLPLRLFRRQYASASPRPLEVIRGQIHTSTINRTQLRSLSSSLPRCGESPTPIRRAPLPVCCPGCGAYAQNIKPDEPGYYGKKTKLQTTQPPQNDESEQSERDQAFAAIQEAAEIKSAPRVVCSPVLEKATDTVGRYLVKTKRPMHLCDRCHGILHHNQGSPAVCPSIPSIRDLIDESPYRRNHVFHLIDAADFPMSLMDHISTDLSIQDPRTKNRRSATVKYKSGKLQTTITFVVTRSDLLGGTKAIVDKKMEYIQSVLREKLKIPVERLRLGNVRMISAHRGWWTKEIKEEILERGGGIWIVGKTNVGKSRFVELCTPKDSKNFEKMVDLFKDRQTEAAALTPSQSSAPVSTGLLPPAPKEDIYPIPPVVSSLPGTTASPIRIPFGHGRGEIFDLPGLEREGFSKYVVPWKRRSLFMSSRIKPESYSIGRNKSLLLLGGLVRITPVNFTTLHQNLIFQAACFLPVDGHVTLNQKAIEMQSQERPFPGTTLMDNHVGHMIQSAGNFELKWDITESHTPAHLSPHIVSPMGEGYLTRPTRLQLYKVMAMDILLEGCGWVELSVQIRTKHLQDADQLPMVEIYSPYGKHIGIRPPMQCWDDVLNKKKADQKKVTKRRGNIGQKKRTLNSS